MKDLINWTYLAWSDIAARYRRSKIGPFWITLTTAISVGAIGFAYSELFKQPIKIYLPYIAVGITTWQFISSSLIELSSTLLSSRSLLLGTPISPMLLLYRVVLRNLLIMAHSLVVVIPVCMILANTDPLIMLIVIPCLFLLAINVWAWGGLAAIMSIRLGDIPQLTSALLSLLFLITPVLWNVELIGPSRLYFADLNPFLHMIEIVRAPMLGRIPPLNSLVWCITMALIGIFALNFCANRFRRTYLPWL